MSPRKSQELIEILARNVQKLREELDLTRDGLANAVGISEGHVQNIEGAKSNVTVETVAKIAQLAGLSPADLFGGQLPELPSKDKLPLYKAFYEANENNVKYFISKHHSGRVAYIIRRRLLPKGFFLKEKTTGEVLAKCREVGKTKRFTSGVVSNMLGRLVREGVLVKRDIHGNGSRFAYQEAGAARAKAAQKETDKP